MTVALLQTLNALPLAGRFTCDEPIAAGQCARSFFGIDQETGRAIHIKILIAPRSASEIARFKNEAFALKTIGKFPMGGNVPKLIYYDTALSGEIHFIVTERADGNTLGNWLRNQRDGSTSNERLAIFHRVAAALTPCCPLFTHRDVHPDNILLLNGEPDWYEKLPDPNTLILDWGQAFMPLLAGYEDSPEFALTLHDRVPKELIGSFYTLPPDVFYPESNALHHPAKHDAWSLGLILHRILTGNTLMSFGSIGDYVESCRSGLLQKTLLDASTEIESLEYRAPLILSRLFKRLTAIKPGLRFDPATAARVMWDIRIEEFSPNNPTVVDQYISDPFNYQPNDGWKFSNQPDYE